ncbi:hypothetical protein OIU91_16585 [Streptomyces sp. NBC_01456]|uniref:hypothetical protein n=1 Tax=Streptomyces sp. NBC_01456 TaxID=2975868 RepID=UPI002E313DB1|nr:hypothetical protein [Streptomyces sp. NBC_01456]
MKGIYFYTTNRALKWAAHLGIIFAALLLPAALILSQFSDTHWAFVVGKWTLMIISSVLLVLHVGSHAHEQTCGLALKSAKSSEDLKKRRYRLVITFARTWPVAVAGLLVFVTATPIIRPEQGALSRDRFHPVYTAATTGALWLILLYLAAYLFYVRNRHHLPERAPTPRAQKIASTVRRICHRSHWLVVGTIGGLLCAVLFLPNDGPWSSVTTAMTFLVMAAFIADGRHSDTLCEPCVAEFRVDAPEYAASKSWVFSLEHRGRAAVWIFVLGAIAVQLVLDDTLASKVATIVINTLFIASAFVNRFHRTYQPWCPYCRDNGGGGHEHTEVPDPAGGHGRPVPA